MMKKRWYLIVAVLVLAFGVGVWKKAPPTKTSVKTVVLTPSSVEQTVTCKGAVEATDGIGVFAPVSCFIREVYVTVGQRVAKGDVLAVIDKETTLDQADDMATRIALAGMNDALVASADGIVVEVSAVAGQKLKMGTPCVILARPSDLRIRIGIREKDLRTLREGMRVRISGDGLERSAYYGYLTEISCAAVSGSTVTMVAGFVTPDAGQIDDSFRLGLTAKATVILSVTEGGYLVPYEAVLSDDSGSFVYLLQNGVARRYGVDGAQQVPNGLLITDSFLENASVILEPEKVDGDGATVTEAVA